MKINIVFVLHLTSYCLTHCEKTDPTKPVNCGISKMPLSQIKETDKRGTLIFRAKVEKKYTWRIKPIGSNPNPNKFFDNALAFDPPDGNNTLQCPGEAKTAMCDLKLMYAIDPEYIKSEYGIAAVPSRTSSIVLEYVVTCFERSKPSSKLTYQYFLVVALVNEFSPKFKIPHLYVEFAKDDLVGGALIYDLTGSAVDEDEGSDGDIFEVTVATKTDLITIKQAFEVVMNRAITLEDLKNGNCLYFVLLVWDSGHPRKSGNVTLKLKVLYNDLTECTNNDNGKSGGSNTEATGGEKDNTTNTKNGNGRAGGLTSSSIAVAGVFVAAVAVSILAASLVAYYCGKRKRKSKEAARSLQLPPVPRPVSQHRFIQPDYYSGQVESDAASVSVADDASTSGYSQSEISYVAPSEISGVQSQAGLSQAGRY